jgi:hypothetical protein
MDPRVLQRLGQLIRDMAGRGLVGIAHAKIDDVPPGGPGPGLQLVDLREDIGRQAPDAMELAVHGLSFGTPSAGDDPASWNSYAREGVSAMAAATRSQLIHFDCRDMWLSSDS